MKDRLKEWIENERNELKERRDKTDCKGEINYLNGRLDQLLLL